MTVLADGAMHACRRFHSPVGNALSDDLEQVFFLNTEPYRRFGAMGACSGCRFRHVCRGCPAVAGSLAGGGPDAWLAPDPQCWIAAGACQ